MSKFVKALEQAERDRALRRHAPGEPHRAALLVPSTPSATAPPSIPHGHDDSARRTPKPVRAGALKSIDPHLVSLLAPVSPVAEQYRALRHVLERRRQAGGPGVVAITAPTIGDGKTTTAINLAGTLAQSPASRVLLVDLDLRRPAVADRLGLADGGPALLQALLRPELTLADVVRPCPPFNLAVLTAGSAAAAPYELLKSPRLGELMADARSGYDWIVLDTPPLVPVSDCRLIGKYVDTFLVVVAAHRTSRRLLEDGLGVLDPSSVLGLVFNGDDDPPHADYYTSDAPASGRQRWESSMLSPIARLRAIWGSRSGHDRRRGLDADGHATPWR